MSEIMFLSLNFFSESEQKKNDIIHKTFFNRAKS